MADNTYDFNQIEVKWQRRWEDDRVHEASSDTERPKFYGLDFFPYPSGAGISVGHCKNYVPVDAYCRYKSMRGYNVLHPMGWDAFGQPAENEAIKRQRHPKPMVAEYAANYRRQMKLVGLGYDWSREINSSEPDYYRWTQWFFLLLYRRGLAYRAIAAINWCPSCATGLANEEVKEGKCWRCGTPVTRKPMPQWFFRITAYAEQLLEGLDRINWPEGVKQMQREWIGRSEGAEVDFRLADGLGDPIRVYTTRPDTLYGATFMVLAPENPRVSELTTPSQRSAVGAYLEAAQRETEIERMSAERVKTGVFTGSYAINPMNGERIPIWVADYVLMGYGTGAIMAVPAHDQRDFEFARKYKIPIVLVYQLPDGPKSGEEMTCALPEGGVMINSGPFNGCDNSKETIQKYIRYLEEKNIGIGKVQYRLRDWLISRQRYWGAPIPIVHCPDCGEVAVPEQELPVRLPDVESYGNTGTGESPLANIPEFLETRCPKCGGPAHRETDTMGGFACSSWYFLRFADPHNSEQAFSEQMVRKWLPVDLYVGGAEHAVMHLLYARMWTKVMYDAGLIEFDEPFLTLKNQGMLLAYTPGRRPQADEVLEGDGDEAIIDWIVLRPEEIASFPKEQIVWKWVKMSKSRGNVITPDEMAEKYGADSLRVYLMFVAPFEETVQWSEEGINGASRFLNRVWRLVIEELPGYRIEWREEVAARPLTPADRRIRRKTHQTIVKVTDDLENFRFNTAIAAMMELVNEINAQRLEDRTGNDRDHREPISPAVMSEAIEMLIRLLAPFAPHIADELWEKLGHQGYLYRGEWPQHDAAVAAEETITLVVQVNGKVRDRLEVPVGLSNDEVKELAASSERVQSFIGSAEVRRIIVVPGKLVNIVAS